MIIRPDSCIYILELTDYPVAVRWKNRSLTRLMPNGGSESSDPPSKAGQGIPNSGAFVMEDTTQLILPLFWRTQKHTNNRHLQVAVDASTEPLRAGTGGA